MKSINPLFPALLLASVVLTLGTSTLLLALGSPAADRSLRPNALHASENIPAAPLSAVVHHPDYHPSPQAAVESSSRVDQELLRLIDRGYHIQDVIDRPLIDSLRRDGARPRIQDPAAATLQEHLWGTISYVLTAAPELRSDEARLWMVEIKIEFLQDVGYRIRQIESSPAD